MKKSVAILVILFQFSSIYSQTNNIIDSLFRNSYKVFELQRLSNGMYRDATLMKGIDYHPISVANTGMGLISLCIADAMLWEANAKELALVTLKSVTGHHSNFIPDRNFNGYYRHFLDTNTGAQAWNSEYSTIDTDILMSGALFAMNYFKDDSISHYVTELWHSIDFEAAIENPISGKIYRIMNEDGTVDASSLTSPYSEYMIVAWLAKNYNDTLSSTANTLWNNYYETVDSLPTSSYKGLKVLSDSETRFLSSFTHQFNYFLCHHFTVSEDYLKAFTNAYEADSTWWRTLGGELYEWGSGAGSSFTDSYHADAINNNPDTIVSPHIIAGFIPVNPNGKNDLISLWNNSKGKYLIPVSSNDSILWRYSLSNAAWVPNEIIGIDHSTMLFGISTLPEYLGNSFFSTNNDFFPLPSLSTPEQDPEFMISIYPNPIWDNININLGTDYNDVNIKIYDITGKIIYSKLFTTLNFFNIEFKEKAGLYLVSIISDGKTQTIRFCKQ